MKAKDYAKQFNESPSVETLSNIAHAFIIECQTIGEVRHVQSESAMLAILNEQDLKWKAFARMIDGVRPDGFEKMIRELMPDIWYTWKARP